MGVFPACLFDFVVDPQALPVALASNAGDVFGGKCRFCSSYTLYVCFNYPVPIGVG